jgi:hypothetical protein
MKISASGRPAFRASSNFGACAGPHPPEYSTVIAGYAFLNSSAKALRERSPGGPKTTTVPSRLAAAKVFSHSCSQPAACVTAAGFCGEVGADAAMTAAGTSANTNIFKAHSRNKLCKILLLQNWSSRIRAVFTNSFDATINELSPNGCVGPSLHYHQGSSSLRPLRFLRCTALHNSKDPELTCRWRRAR